MRRWHLTTGLAVTAALAALLAPTLRARLLPVTAPPVPVATPAVSPAETSPERPLELTVHAPVLAGHGPTGALDVVLVMDASGSMQADRKMSAAQQAAHGVVGRLGADDTFGLVTFSDEASVLVSPAAHQDRGRMDRQIDRILEGGGTNLFAGLEEGLRALRTVRGRGKAGRLILLSDGQANIGVTDPERLTELVQLATEQGITVSTVGLGEDYDAELLQRLASVGRGSFDPVADSADLEGVFGRIVDEAHRVVPDAWVDVELPQIDHLFVPGRVSERTPSGWRIFLGDLPAGSTQRLQARVRLPADYVGPFGPLELDARYDAAASQAPVPRFEHAPRPIVQRTTIPEVHSSTPRPTGALRMRQEAFVGETR